MALGVDKRTELLLEEDSSPLAVSSDAASVSSRASSPSKPGAKKSKLKSPKKSKDRDEGEIKLVKIPVVAGMGLGLKIKTDEAKHVARISEVRSYSLSQRKPPPKV